MKKILYFIAAVALTASLGACTADTGGTNPGNDKKAVITAHLYDTPAQYNPEQTVYYRVFVNNKVNSVKVLYELKKDKDAFIEANSEQEYLEKVLAQGVELTLTNGSAEDIKENLPNIYAITLIGLDEAGNIVVSKELIYRGVNWIEVGTVRLEATVEWFVTLFGSADFTLTGLELRLWRSEFEFTYLKIESPYDELWDGVYTGQYDIKVRCNADGGLTFTNKAESVAIAALGTTVDKVYTGIVDAAPYFNFSFGIDSAGKVGSDYYSYSTIDDDGVVTEMVWNLAPIADNGGAYVGWGDLILTPQYNE